MGQQQLLLVILVTILVGIATVVAINVFGSAATEANRDAVRQDILQGVASAQALYAKPILLDGAGGTFATFDNNNAMLRRLNMPVVLGGGTCTEAVYGNENGCYAVSGRGADGFTLTGTPASGTDAIVAAVTVTEVTDTDGTRNEWTIAWDE